MAGGVLYGIFLIFSGINLILIGINLGLFCELIIVWNAMSYLTAIKDYKGIMLSFLAAVLVTFVTGYIFLKLGMSYEIGMMLAVFTGYGVMLVWDMILLYSYFPQSSASAFLFLRWIDQFLPLAFTGLCINLGLFAHLVIMWAGPIGIQVQGLFYGAPWHDVPALLAFMTILVTTVNFVVSVEVNFYPKYRAYYSLFNDQGSIGDIIQAENEMLEVLNHELKYTAIKQLFTTALAISIGEIVLTLLPLGFNDLMQGYFRILCAGYGVYAVGETVVLILLYFTDYKGALFASALFALVAGVGTVISLFFPQTYYGFAFMIGSSAFLVAALIRLDMFTKKLPYYILSTQPVVEIDKYGLFTRLEYFLEKKLEGGTDH